jgi:hypothetical protein
LIYSDILEFFEATYRFYRRPAWHLFFTFCWGLFERRFTSIKDRLAYHCHILEKNAAATHYVEMKKWRDARMEEIEKDEQQRSKNMEQEVRTWLTAAEADQEDSFHEFADKREPQTCDWILDDQRVYSWIEEGEDKAFLWLTGIPGSGKSVLSSMLLQHLKMRKDITTLYFFCGPRQFEGGVCTVLKTITVQMLQQNPDMTPQVHQTYYQKMRTESIHQMKKMLAELLSDVPYTRVIIDGVDELDPRLQQDILRAICEIQKQAGEIQRQAGEIQKKAGEIQKVARESCKVLISSRSEPQIRKELPKTSNMVNMDLENMTTEALEIYIQRKVELLKPEFPGLETDIFQRVEDRLRKLAKGMFLWVHLVTSMLSKQVSEAEFEMSIEKLPDGIEKAYERILTRFRSLEGSQKERARGILNWLCASYRPMKMHEVADGVVLKPGQLLLNKKTRINNIDRDIVELCAPMVEKSGHGVLSLVHFTAKEYIIDDLTGPFIDTTFAHFSIAFSCITNLKSASKIVPQCALDVLEKEKLVMEGSFGLQSYAHQFWAVHVRSYLKSAKSSDCNKVELIKALTELCSLQRGGYDESASVLISNKEELPGLVDFPAIRSFVVQWLKFRSELEKKSLELPSSEDQRKWALQADESYLTLIDNILREITEGLLRLEISRLPSHISAKDFEQFSSRYRFKCGFHNCNLEFGSARLRHEHEITHIPSFPCEQCDFSGRGFRSRGQLERHKKLYHLSLSDVNVPQTLDTTESATFVEFARSLSRAMPNLQCWNQTGQHVLQQSFERVLSKVESRLNRDGLYGNNSPEEALNKSNHQNLIKFIKERIKSNHYQSLGAFKDDIRTMVRQQYQVSEGADMDLVVDQEMESATKGFSSFASLNTKSSTPETSISNGSVSNAEFDVRNTSAAESTHDLLSDRFSGAGAYWSRPERSDILELVKLNGRDVRKISSILKTKTAEEVERYLMQLEDAGTILPGDPMEDAGMKLDLEPDLPQSGSETLTDGQEANTSDSNTPNEMTLDYQLPVVQAVEGPVAYNLVSGSSINGPQQPRGAIPATPYKSRHREGYKRKKHPNEVCGICKHEFHSFNALKKHGQRFHEPMRPVWVCKDVSMDKKFFGDCKLCGQKNKRYGSKHSAFTHLRKNHFKPDSTPEVLERWIEELEEKNPQYHKAESDAHVAYSAKQTRPPTETAGQRKQQSSPFKLSNINNSPSEIGQANNVPLPAISTQSSSSMEEDISDDGKADEDVKLKNPWKALLNDVTFDHMLPGQKLDSNAKPKPHNSATDPERRALITPEHILRFPKDYHLNEYQRNVYHDQVVALYHTLETQASSTKPHKEALKRLEDISKELAEGLRKWRRETARAPELPFSL